MNHPVNPVELKKWIVSHANYYRNCRRDAITENLKQYYEGQMGAMKALWSTLKTQQKFNHQGLYKKMDSI